MVHCVSSVKDSEISYVIMPNQAISWHNLLILYAGIAGFAMLIGASFYLLGYPLVLPFSGIEIIALGAALYMTTRKGGIREVITIRNDSVAIETGRCEPETREVIARQWAQVVLQRSRNNWYSSRLVLRSHGKQYELGKFLNEQERLGLACELGKALKINKF